MEKIITVGNNQYVVKYIYDMSMVSSDESNLNNLKIKTHCDSILADKQNNRYILANIIDEAKYTELPQ